jgi:hypothetical protein
VPAAEPQAPLAWWDSSAGVNETALAALFPGVDTSPADLAGRPEPDPPLAGTVTGALAKLRPRRAAAPRTPAIAGQGPAQAGDVYAVRARDGQWITVYCHETGQRGTTKAVKTEYLQGVFTEMPTAGQIVPAFQPRVRAGGERCQSWTASLDSTSWVRRIARGVPAPAADLPEPDQVTWERAKNLAHVAWYCFPEID